MQDMHLFQLLNVLRALKPPDRVSAILHTHPAVASAAEVYPLGLESLTAQHPTPEGGPQGKGFVYAGSGSEGDRRLVAGMIAAHHGDPSAVQRLLAEARHLYHVDTDTQDPNLAPRVFWPSCHAYKVAMHWFAQGQRRIDPRRAQRGNAGDHLEKDVEPLLAEIPDPDFILLASIDLAAGALHLPQHSGVRMSHHPKSTHRI